MPTQQTFYLDAPTLATATKVFLDSGMTLCAPDGYYSDGTVARQQVGCVLLPAESCPACGEPCENSIEEAISYEGTYFIPFNAGTVPSSIGAIIVTINVDNSVCGIRATFDNVTFYNELSSPTYGYLAGTPGGHTYIGGGSYDCGIDGTTYTLDEYIFDGTVYTPTGLQDNVTPTTGEIAFTPTDPGVCVMVIPKPTNTPFNLSINIIGPCPTSKAFVSVSCPLQLPSMQRAPEADPESPLYCSYPYIYTFYVAPVNGDGIELGLYDWVFNDINGVSKMADGFYRCPTVPIGYDTFEVQNGVVVAFYSYCAG